MGKSKYSVDFKLKAIKRYHKGDIGTDDLGKRIGVCGSLVRKWIKFYELYGVSGLVRLSNTHYTKDFKLKILSVIEKENLSLKEASRRFNIPAESSILIWQRNYKKNGILGLENRPRGRPKTMSNYKRKKENRQTLNKGGRTVGEDLLFRSRERHFKKVRRLNSGKEKSKAIEELRQDFDLAVLHCTSMARSSFYYYQKRFQMKDKYAEIKEMIKQIYHRHKGRLGYRRITLLLKEKGILINHKTVLRLMKILGLKSIIRVKKYKSYKGEQGKIAPNVLQRNFKSDTPNQKWATDVTEFNVSGNKLYLSPIIDLFNGEIISFDLSERPVFSQIIRMLKKSFRKVKSTQNIILHSDQGWQYQMKHYQNLLKEKGIIQSMSRKGNCLDNAVIENFFGTIKSEMFYTRKFGSIQELKKEIVKYIHYYNNDRIRLNLKGKSPVQYRTLSFENIV
jgi:transposase InsO family protein/transposase-like protein